MWWKSKPVQYAWLSLLLLTVTWTPEGQAEPKWTFLERSDGVSLWSRAKGSSESPQFKAVVTIPYSAQKVASVLTDIPSHIHFVPHVKSVAVLERKTLKSGAVRQLIYQVNALPIVSDRDLLIATDTWTEGSAPDTTWFSTWKHTNNRRYPPREELVRMPVVEGAWSISPSRKGAQAKVVYIIHTEVGGSIPPALSISGQRGAAIEFLSNLEARCHALYRPKR